MKSIFKYVLTFVVMLCISSCVDDLDFNQAKDLEITPAVNISLIKSKVNQNNLVVGGSEVGSISEVSTFTILDNDVARDNLERAVLRFEIINNFARDFRVTFTLLDENDARTYTDIILNVTANQTDFALEEEIILADNPNFINSRKINVELTLLPSSDGSTLDANTPNSLTFKSAGTFYFRVN